MANDPTFGELYKSKAILEADLEAAVDAFMADPTTYRVLIGEGYTTDPHTAVSASPFALGLLSMPDAKPGSQRSTVQTAILLSKPVKG